MAAIPTGLPAVVTALLSMGTREIARRNAIVKRLPAVETLGSTSAICSDKTGTLTLNKMTARELAIPGHNMFTVSGEGYGLQGEIRHVGGSRIDLDPYLLPMVLCADAVLDGEGLIGDPTEGALIVLAGKGGLDIDATKRDFPRIAEVPFDSEYKFMATFHDMTDTEGRPVVRCYVKGAPDVLIDRGASYRSPDGSVVPISDENRSFALEANDRMANAGERVMVVAQREFDPATFDKDGDLIGLVTDLTLLAMVGIVDPPRSEARAAIAECHDAGIQVRMITGDHATTAAAIAAELGIEGRALTGTEFAAMTDDELLRDLPNIGVVARVAPEDKIRLVQMLKRSGNIVAMTGDGVNDAPALKAADIGVAMGITGTEVSKEAAVMILTDDNFATIVSAVSYGRALYDNLVKYLRFQMSTLVAYIAIFLAAGVLSIAGGVPLNPLQILWLNMVIDIPIAIALGFDQPTRGLMARPPRPVSAPVLSRANWVRLCVQGAIMTVGSLVAYQIGDDMDGAVVGATMLLTTLSVFHVVAGLMARDQLHTIFDRDALPGVAQLRRYGISVLAIVAITTIDIFQRIFGTTELTGDQWAICLGLACEPAGHRGSHQVLPAPPRARGALWHRTRGRHPTTSHGLRLEEGQHVLQPSQPQLPQGAGLHTRRAPVPAQAVRRAEGREVRRLREASPGGQERRPHLREDLDQDPDGVRGGREGPGSARHLPRAERFADRPQGVDEGHGPRARADLRRHRVPRVRAGERRDPGAVRGCPGVERADRRVPPHPDPRRHAHHDRAQRQAPDRHRLLLPRRCPQQHGQLAHGRRLQARHGRAALRSGAPLAGGRPRQVLPGDRGPHGRAAHPHGRRGRGGQRGRLPVHRRLGLHG